MTNIELDYIEINGLLYPNIEIEGKELLYNLDKYGIQRLRYLHKHRPEIYRELLFTGKLAEHCDNIGKTAFRQAERIRTDYLKMHPVPEEDTMERIRLSTRAQMIADENVCAELIYL